MKEILLISRSIEPPWDEASRNFVRSIAANLDGYNFHLVTGMNGSSINRKNVFDNRIYTKRELDLSQKIRLASTLFSMRDRFDIYHFCFVPERFSSLYIRKIMPHNSDKLKIQTIPYIPDWALGRQ